MKGYIVDGKEIKLIRADWEILVMLDGCRYDLFKKNLPVELKKYELKKAISNAHGTFEWLEKNFNQKTDIIYLSPLIYLDKYLPKIRNKFSDVVDVWKEGWDTSMNNISQKYVTKQAIHYSKQNKRIIVHYGAFWGGAYPTYRKGVFWEMRLFCQKNIPTIILWNINKLFSPSKVIEKRQKIIEHYERQLKTFFPPILQLIKQTNKKILITADHGTLQGEFGYYGAHHSRLIQLKKLVEVPWMEIQK